MNPHMNFPHLQSATRPHGLRIIGDFAVTKGDQAPPVNGSRAAHLVLVGNAGSEMWGVFRQSAEYADARADPLNRWSARIGEELAARFSARAVFPFGASQQSGAPHPFIRWGKRAGLQNSALGMLIHPRFGLWHAYRFALIFARAPAESAVPPELALRADICLQCEAKPCLRACPVGAFNSDGYDVRACCGYLRDAPQSPCMRDGCIARIACPHADFRYARPHAAFHMRAFVTAMDGGEFGGMSGDAPGDAAD
ncbi:MAG: hypothetical protein OD918_03515 [Gammaproteobacteria bacterium]